MKFVFVCLLCALNAAAFEVRSFSEQMPESNPVTCFRVTQGKTIFSMMPPKGWTMSSDANLQRVVLQSGSLGAIIVQVSTNAMPAKPGALRQEVSNRFKDASIQSEFDAVSGATRGLGIDVRHVVEGNHVVLTRLCVFKSGGGTVEICFVRRPEDDVALQPAWGQFINSFRVESPKHVAQSGQ
jgi:hypothetical protein